MTKITRDLQFDCTPYGAKVGGRDNGSLNSQAGLYLISDVVSSYAHPKQHGRGRRCLGLKRSGSADFEQILTDLEKSLATYCVIETS